MAQWVDGTVEARQQVAPGLVHVRVRAQAEVLRSFTRAGQFQKLSADGGATQGHFALANAPGEGALEYLMRSASGAASLALTALAPGERLSMGPVEGPGFPLEQTVGHPLLLVAVGSGLAPMRSVLRALEPHRALNDGVSLFYGVNTPEDFPFADELAGWEARGLKLVRSVTVPDARWSGATGFIQTQLAGPPLPADTVVFLVGQKDMLAASKALLLERGVPAKDMHLNY